jgi:predicted DNA-binding transcriptional regulator AlpA
MTADLALLPRFIRAKQAPAYLGMCRAVFDAEVRPHIREFPIGKQGVGFDRFELDAWADAYVARKSIEKAANQDNNQPRSERHGGAKGETPWPKKQSQVSSECRVASGKSTKSTEEKEFKRVLALVTKRKPSSS